MMRSDFTQTVTTVRTASWLAHERACDLLLPDPAQLRPLTMRWLDGHLPLTLLMDLAMPNGPHSDELFADEPESPTAGWQPPEPAGRPV